MLEREGSIKTSGVGGVTAMEQLGTSLYLTEVGYKAVGGIQPRAARGEFSQGSAASSLGHVYLVPPWCGHSESGRWARRPRYPNNNKPAAHRGS